MLENNNDNDITNSFMVGHFPPCSSDNLPPYAATVDVMLLQNDLNTWKRSYTEANWEIEKLKSEKSVLELEVSIWKARFMALRSGFFELDRKMKQIFASFEGWRDTV